MPSMRESIEKYFNVGPFEVSGGSEVINNLHYKLDTTGYFTVDGGPAFARSLTSIM
ncbi:MAG: hypothetical protein U5K54_18960 [Cytophagales bacterium]|nr:hypothetical protein [Cytophagales bacterium]